MRRVIFVLLMLAALNVTGQSSDGIEEIMRFLGTDSPEELEEAELERLSGLLGRPLKINHASRSKLSASGLFDRYQIASLTDYLSRYGDVLSLTELSYIDGFGASFVDRISPFISVDSSGPLDSPKFGKPDVRASINIRGGYKMSQSASYSGGMKAVLEYGETFMASIGVSCPYECKSLEDLSWSCSVGWMFRRLPGKVIAGDFNARFGQGLALWNGLTFSSLTSASAVMRNPRGITPSASFTGSSALTGLATDMSFGRFTLSALCAFPGIKTYGNLLRTLTILPALNLVWYCKYGQLGVTACSDLTLMPRKPVSVGSMTSLDARFCVRGTDLFAEVAYDMAGRSVAALGGAVVPVGENVRLSSMLRYYPPAFHSLRGGAFRSSTSLTNEYGLTVAGEFDVRKYLPGSHRGVFSLDAARFPEPRKGDDGRSVQLRFIGSWEWRPVEGLTTKLRISQRYRSWGALLKNELRADVNMERGLWSLNFRGHIANAVGWGLLSYLETGRKWTFATVWLRLGIFRIDDWDDRIYVYERDAPGTYNVPVFYGRGAWSSLTLSGKISDIVRIYLRAGYTFYMLMPEEKRKPGRAELRLQGVFSF